MSYGKHDSFLSRCLTSRSERGQGLAEYIIIAILVALVVLVAVRLFGQSVYCRYLYATKQIDGVEYAGCLAPSGSAEPNPDDQTTAPDDSTQPQPPAPSPPPPPPPPPPSPPPSPLSSPSPAKQCWANATAPTSCIWAHSTTGDFCGVTNPWIRTCNRVHPARNPDDAIPLCSRHTDQASCEADQEARFLWSQQVPLNLCPGNCQ